MSGVRRRRHQRPARVKAYTSHHWRRYCHGYSSKITTVVDHYYLLLTAYYLLLTTDYSLLTTHYSLLAIHYLLLTTHYSLLATHYSLLTTHYSLLTTHYSLLTTHYSLQALLSRLQRRWQPSRLNFQSKASVTASIRSMYESLPPPSRATPRRTRPSPTYHSHTTHNPYGSEPHHTAHAFLYWPMP